MEKIDVFELVIDVDDESGNAAISFVDMPAIESNWHRFNKQSEYKFEIKDEEKRIVEGYAMIADLLIPRIDENGKKFFVKFSAKTISAIREKQSRLGLNNSFNLMHDSGNQADGVYMLDNLIIDNKRGKIAPSEFEKVPDGSLWISAKVDNDEIWNSVKDGTFRGFSVEGMYKQLEPVKVSEDVIEKIRQTIQDFEKTVEDSVQVINNKTIESMSMKVIEDLKAVLFKTETVEEVVETPETTTEVEVKLMAMELVDGTVISIDPAVEVGAMVTIEIEGELEAKALPNGEYTLADGTVFVVTEGAISDVKEVEAEEEEDMNTEAPVKAETPTEQKIRKIIESTETVFAKVDSLVEAVATITEEFAKYKETVEENNKAIFTAVEEIAVEPSKEPVAKKKSSFMAAKKTPFVELLAEKRKNKKQ